MYKKSLFDISEFSICCLILSININGANFFHTKELFFFLSLLLSMRFGSYKNLFPFFTMISIYFISLISNFSNPYMDLNQGLRYILGLCYLIIFIFLSERYKSLIVKAYFVSAMLVAILTVGIWLICNSFPVIKNAMILYFSSLNTGEYAFLFMIRNRKILGWWIMGVYYCTAPCMIPALAYSYTQFFKYKAKKYFACSLMLSVGLIFTMARANILAALAVNFLSFAFNLLRKKKLTSFFFVTFSALLCAITIVTLFLSDKTEGSLSIKALHKESYNEVFDSSLLKYVVTGWGAGSEFYSKGYKEWTFITELSLHETIRRYGLIQTAIIFFAIWLTPIIRFCISKKRFADKFFWGGVFFTYLFVACTNPFLLGSIGFCALLFMSTILRYSLENKEI